MNAFERFINEQDRLSALLKTLPVYEAPASLKESVLGIAHEMETQSLPVFTPPESLKNAVLKEAQNMQRAQAPRRDALLNDIAQQQSAASALGAPVSEETEQWLKEEAARHPIPNKTSSTKPRGWFNMRRLGLAFTFIFAVVGGAALHHFYTSPESGMVLSSISTNEEKASAVPENAKPAAPAVVYPESEVEAATASAEENFDDRLMAQEANTVRLPEPTFADETKEQAPSVHQDVPARHIPASREQMEKPRAAKTRADAIAQGTIVGAASIAAEEALEPVMATQASPVEEKQKVFIEERARADLAVAEAAQPPAASPAPPPAVAPPPSYPAAAPLHKEPALLQDRSDETEQEKTSQPFMLSEELHGTDNVFVEDRALSPAYSASATPSAQEKYPILTLTYPTDWSKWQTFAQSHAQTATEDRPYQWRLMVRDPESSDVKNLARLLRKHLVAGSSLEIVADKDIPDKYARLELLAP
jgi:hypothetical protein